MKINKTKAVFEFDKREYFLVYTNDDRFGADSHMKTWSFNYKINRSEKGKDPDVGIPVMYLSDDEAEVLKAEGFDWLNL